MDSSDFASKKLIERKVFTFVYPAINERLNFMRSCLDDIRTLSPYRAGGYVNPTQATGIDRVVVTFSHQLFIAKFR
jgi:hypothetical protein